METQLGGRGLCLNMQLTYTFIEWVVWPICDLVPDPFVNWLEWLIEKNRLKGYIYKAYIITETLVQPCYFLWSAITKAAKGSGKMHWGESIYLFRVKKTLLVLHLCLSFRNLMSFLASPLGDAVRRASTFMIRSLALWRAITGFGFPHTNK